MPDPTTYHRMVLTFNAPRLYDKGASQDWSLKFSLSGAAIAGEDPASVTAIDLAQPALLLSSPSCWLKEWRYYAAGSTVALYSGSFDDTANPATGGGWDSFSDLVQQQTEVCAHAYVATGGRSSTGKPTYLSKSIHYVAGAVGDNGVVAGTLYGDPFDNWNSGSGPDSVVPVSPTTGEVPTTAWAIRPWLATRQMRKTR